MGCDKERLVLANACTDAGGHWLVVGSRVRPEVPNASCLFLATPRITFVPPRAVVEDTTGGRR